MNFKKKIFELIDDSGIQKTKWNKRVDLFIVGLIFISIIEIILESHKHIRIAYSNEFAIVEFAIVSIFTIEYILRVWTSDLRYPELNKFKARLKFVFSPLGLIDLVAILPFFLPFFFKFDLRFIRLLRMVSLLRIFKLYRYTRALRLVGKVVMDKKSELGITVFIAIILILVSSTIMYHLEHKVQPDQFPNIISTFWWSIATLTTVGYGDVYPVTSWGKVVAGIIALLGIGLVALPTGIISSGFIENLYPETPEDNCFCPNCGKKLK